MKATSNSLALKKAILVIALCWTLLIAILCLFRFNNLPSIAVTGADKYVHFTFHLIFTFLWGKYFWLRLNGQSIYTILKVGSVSIVYGIILEILQEVLTTTRHADIMDIAANFTGALVAFLLFIASKRSVFINFKLF